jgi:hypothetical protein
VRGDHLGAWLAPRGDLGGRPGAPRAEGAQGAFLVDQEGRVERAGGVIQGDDQIELRVQGGQPAMRRAVLMQEHAAQRPARAFLAVRPAARRLGDQPGRLQAQLGPGVAPRKTVALAQLVVEMLGREAAVTLAIQGQHLVDLIDRHPPAGGLAEPSIEQARGAFAVVAIPPAPEGPLAHPQDLGGLGLAQPALSPAPIDLLELHLSQSLQHLRPPHPPLPAGGPDPTGQIACYEDRSYRVSATRCQPRVDGLLSAA